MTQHNKSALSRRQMLAFLGLGGVGAVTCSAAGLAGLLMAAANKEPTAARQVFITATPQPTPDAVDHLLYPDAVPRELWGAFPPDTQAPNENGFYNPETNPEGWRMYDVPLREAYQTVVIHHSVIDTGDTTSTLLEIQKTHRDDRGWADVAYHYFVGQNGVVYGGRDIRARGTHVGGYNTGSVGVCLLGDFTQIQPTAAQISATRELVRWLADTLALTHLAGHRDFNDWTQCPGTAVIPYLEDFAFYANLAFGTAGYITPEDQSVCACCGCSGTSVKS
jgi:hypothetical protein